MLKYIVTLKEPILIMNHYLKREIIHETDEAFEISEKEVRSLLKSGSFTKMFRCSTHSEFLRINKEQINSLIEEKYEVISKTKLI